MKQISELTSILERIEQLQLDGAKVLDVARGFMDEAAEYIEEMNQASQKRNLARLKHAVSHARCCYENLGAESLTSICIEIERLLESGEMFRVGPEIEKLEGEFESLQRAINDFGSQQAA